MSDHTTTEGLEDGRASLAAAGRVSGDDSQQIFDALLRTVAEPGMIAALPAHLVAVNLPTPLWVPLALADVDTAVSIVGADADRLAAIVHEATNAPIVEVDRAWVVTVLDEPRSVLDRVPIGTALTPEAGARLTLPCDGLHEDGATAGADVTVTLQGPGIAGTRRLGVDGVPVDTLTRLGRRDERFPAGFDTWLVTPNGHLAAIPRSTTVTVEAG